MPELHDREEGPRDARLFATTHWTVVRAAGDRNGPEALEKLCRTYWYPLYAYVRQSGLDAEDAQDLTQEFFLRLLRKNYPAQADPGKGKFRSFLLLTLRHFLADEYDRARTRKRGGGQLVLSLSEEAAEEQYCLELPSDASPEQLFERRWARKILEQAVARLRSENQAPGRAEAYSVLRAFEPGEQCPPSYAEAASRLGISESAVKSMVYRLRQRHRELVRDEIAQTVSTEAEIEEELRHLIAVISN
jgi:RNA polymerase sigma factor (sigma-70 family)